MPPGSHPHDVAPVLDGTVWYTAQRSGELGRLDPATGETTGVLARSLGVTLDPSVLPVAEPISFPTGGGATARALYFPPANGAFRGPDGERPPLLVLSHGGPTGAASSALSLDRAFFTSRGIAVVALSPGWVRTDMGGAGAALSPEASVQGLRKVLAAMDMKRSGSFLSHDGSPIPW